MKAIFLSLVFMSNVTASPNTGLSLSADYSESDSDKIAGLLDRFWEHVESWKQEAELREKEKEKELKKNQRRRDLFRCLAHCDDECSFPELWQERICRNRCKANYANSRPPGLSLATASLENPFKLLEDYEFMEKQAVEPENKAPLMLADDYEDCMHRCTCNGGSSKACHEVCERE